MTWDDARPHVKRLISCLFGGFVLALVIGDHEGSQDDFGVSFSKATSEPRLAIFLLVGVVIFLVITFRPYVMPYVTHPGAVPVGIGFLIVLASLALMNWYDPVGKFGDVSSAVSGSHNVPALTGLWFSWVGWALFFACLVLGAAAVATRLPVIGYVQVVLGVASAVICYWGHDQLVDWDGHIDHSLGVYMAVVGFLVYACGGLIAARSTREVAAPREFFDRVLLWRPGLPLVVLGIVFGLVGFISAAWFAPLALNDDFAKSRSDFRGTGLPQLTTTYLDWLGVTLFAVAAAAGLVCCLLRLWRMLAWAAAALALVGLVLTFVALHDLTTTGARVADAYGKTWQNLGAGGWVVCLGFCLVAVGGFLAATARVSIGADQPLTGQSALPVHALAHKAKSSLGTKTILPIAVAFALFYPPTLPVTWQNVLVTQIGVFILLAVGLNVVVGWAGLLDLGYIAFYGIGSYTTAYLTGALPLKPPSWLQMGPLVSIPFAIVACLIAGVLLGAPTLRLRGDYLAIVTLGFGEIIQIIAINNPGNLTGGPQGPHVRHPTLHLGVVKITWGLDNLPYWYLLLVFIIVMVVLFYRLEGSRLGRAWAAIREDEVAAQATGINTMRAKLLAFAIGASTSGLAGVFFASQVGYFDPSQFTLQYSILIVAYVVFGGMGSLPGAIAGAAALTWLPQFLKDQVPLDDRQMWIGALVLAMMIFRPAGLLPAKRRRAELTGLDAPSSAETRAVPASEGM